VLFRSLQNLAASYIDAGRTEEALPVAQKTVVLRKKILGPEHPKVGESLYLLARTEESLGHDELAIEHLQEAMDIRVANFGGEHVSMSKLHHGLGRIYLANGHLELAEFELEKSVTMARLGYGKDHINVASYSLTLARLRRQQGRAAEAMDLAEVVEKASLKQLQAMMYALSERQALLYSARRPQALDLALQIALEENDGQWAPRCFDLLLDSRGVVLDAMLNRAVAGTDSSDGLVIAWREMTAEWARLASSSGGDWDDANDAEALLKLTKQRDELELLVASSQADLDDFPARDSRLEGIQLELPDGGALVSYVLVQRDEDQVLAAFVVLKNRKELQLIELMPLTELTNQVSSWRSEIKRAAVLPASELPGAEEKCRLAGEELRRGMLDPVLTLLGSAELIFVVPAGPLHSVNFSALPMGTGYLVEEGNPEFHVLAAERDLLRYAGAANGEGLLVLGGAEFGAVNEAVDQLNPCVTLADVQFDGLPATADEIERIEKIWHSVSDESVARLEGEAASEWNVRSQVQGKGVIHLATHGFFVLGDCLGRTPVYNRGTRGIGGITPSSNNAAFPPVEHSLRLAGLALAGANDRLNRTDGTDDGILTAEEIVTLPLTDAQWVVLSACDTGAGEVAGVEGLLGLQRSLQIAGARTVIASLWPVSDDHAPLWMEKLYTARFVDKMSTVAAIHAASQGVLADRRASNLSTHPFFWGGFVASGDWR